MSTKGDFEVKKFAIKYEPPTLVIEYRNNFNGKTFLKKIRLLGAIGKDAGRLTEKIISENSDLLGPSNASRDQILSLMQIIIDKSLKPLPSDKTKVKEYGDLNKASDIVIEKAKSEMNVDFEANRVSPADKNYVWDKKVEFPAPVGLSDWDDDDD